MARQRCTGLRKKTETFEGDILDSGHARAAMRGRLAFAVSAACLQLGISDGPGELFLPVVAVLHATNSSSRLQRSHALERELLFLRLLRLLAATTAFNPP